VAGTWANCVPASGPLIAVPVRMSHSLDVSASPTRRGSLPDANVSTVPSASVRSNTAPEAVARSNKTATAIPPISSLITG